MKKYAAERRCSRIRSDIAHELQKMNGKPELWQEDTKQPYQTDRLGWEGLSGIIYRFAYALTPKLTMPSAVPDLADLPTDPALAGLSEGSGPLHLLSEMWIPGDFDASISLKFSSDRTINVSSLGALSRELEAAGRVLGIGSRD
jgi:hypothetical protein